jgi:geranylgeranyl pyrophosphate synthase
MTSYKEEALLMLEQFPESPAKAAMKELVNYVIERKH